MALLCGCCAQEVFFSSVFLSDWCEFFLLHTQFLSLLVHSFVLKQVENKFSDQLSLSIITQTHLSPGKGTINGPKFALFTQGETIIVYYFSYISLSYRRKVTLRHSRWKYVSNAVLHRLENLVWKTCRMCDLNTMRQSSSVHMETRRPQDPATAS